MRKTNTEPALQFLQGFLFSKRLIDVTKIDDGTFNVVGGQANSDKNIYVVDGSGKQFRCSNLLSSPYMIMPKNGQSGGKSRSHVFIEKSDHA